MCVCVCVCVCVQYLEELGVMEQVRQFAGTSAGGMLAGLLAVGYNSYEIEQFLSDRIDKIFLGELLVVSLLVLSASIWGETPVTELGHCMCFMDDQTRIHGWVKKQQPTTKISTVDTTGSVPGWSQWRSCLTL